MKNRSCPKCSSVKNIIIFLSYITTFAYTQIYFSPGLQYGFNFDKEHFFSYQITIGTVEPPGFPGIRLGPAFPGITLGQRRYFGKNIPLNMKEFNYWDVQLNFFVLGFGYGRMWNKNYGNFEKYKLFGGFFLLGSYDYVNFNNEMNNNNHFGIFGVYPLMLTPGYDMMRL